MNKEIEIAKGKGFSENEMEDIIVVEAIKSGDNSKFASIMDKYYKVILGKMIRYCDGNVTEAEDITSDVMLKALENIGKFSVKSGNGKFHSWIHRMAWNTFVDSYRKGKKAPIKNSTSISTVIELGESSITPIQIKDNALNVVEQIEETDKIARLKKALATLSEKEQKILEMQYFSNMKFDEISENLGINLNTCRVTAKRAKAKLKKMLE